MDGINRNIFGSTSINFPTFGDLGSTNFTCILGATCQRDIHSPATMPGPLDGPLGPLPNMFWDPVRAKYFPNPRQSTAVPNQPRPERPNMRPPSPTRNSKTIMTHVKEMSFNENPNSSSGPADPNTSMVNAGPRRNFFTLRRLDGSGGVPRSPLTPSTYQSRMRGLVHQIVCSNEFSV
jgi:hypothetical protein